MITDLVVQHFEVGGLSVRHHRVSTIAPEVLLQGITKDADLAGMIEDVENAHGVIIATPIYKASYSGMLKCFLDILPQFALAGKAILPIGTGGSVAHVLALEGAASPLWEAVRHFTQALSDNPQSRSLGHPRPPQPASST